MMMKLTELGEFGFIARLARKFRKNLPESITGIGDDCAVIPVSRKTVLLVTTDMLVENIHFLMAMIKPVDLGFKCLAVNVSDIVSMGGTPSWAFISLSIPEGLTVEYLDGFYTGIKKACSQFKVSLLGGDTTKSPTGFVIDLALIGQAKPGKVKFRTGAKPGNIIAVSDYLGDSAAGLKIILENLTVDKDASYLIKRHYRPRLNIDAGQWLASKRKVTAMMDVSDGLDSDIQRIMEQSRCGADIYLENMPVSPQLKRLGTKYGWDIQSLAASGGEDYCLLLTIDKDSFPDIEQAFCRKFGRKIYAVGKITSRRGKHRYFKNGQQVSLSLHGYDHFRNRG